MRVTRKVAIGIAVACGAVAAILSVIYLRGLQKKPQKPKKTKKAEVVVAGENIPARTIIHQNALKIKKVPVDKIPRYAVKSPSTIEGNVSVERISAGNTITRNQVMARGVAFGLAGTVPSGMRAVTVSVSPITGLAGLLKPGDHVDVVGTFDVGDNYLVKTVLQDVELLALGAKTTATTERKQKKLAKEAAEQKKDKEGQPEPRPADYTSATLATTPEDAQKLLLAQSRGELQLVLRPVGETGYTPVPEQDLVSFLGSEYEKMLARQGETSPQKAPPDGARRQTVPPPQPPQPEGEYPPPTSDETETASDTDKTEARSVQVIRGNQATDVVPQK